MPESSAKKPFFSIIIPVHKTEQFLEQCLKSVKNQTFEDFECIVINDGSSGVDLQEFSINQDPDWQHEFLPTNTLPIDQCEYIFTQVCSQDSRFKLIKQDNQGVSMARNKGLENSLGEYIIFIDSDDWILPNHLENFTTNIQNQKLNTLLSFTVREYYNTKQIIPQFVPKHINIANLLQYRSIFTMWNTILSNQIIKKYKIKVDPRFGGGPARSDRISNFSEDHLFMMQYTIALQTEYGKFEVKFIENTYKYREVNSIAKFESDTLAYYRHSVFLKSFLKKYSLDFITKMTLQILPHWASLATATNKIVIFYRKILTLFLRLITRCYF